MSEPPKHNVIAIRIEEISQLFNNLDPFPFRNTNLDKKAEEFIVSWARELPGDKRFKILVQLPKDQLSLAEAQEIGPAISQFFIYRSQVIGLELKELFRVGRRSLVIGLTVLFLAVVASQTVPAKESPPLGKVVQESLIIFAWVANWRPIEIFLYEWWPIVRRRNFYRRLGDAEVDLSPYKSVDEGRQALPND